MVATTNWISLLVKYEKIGKELVKGQLVGGKSAITLAEQDWAPNLVRSGGSCFSADGLHTRF